VNAQLDVISKLSETGSTSKKQCV